MIKKINYFIQAIFVYFFFIVGRILGLKLSRKLFAFIFLKLGPTMKSHHIIYKNLKIFSNSLDKIEIEKVVSSMWKNYGMTFIEYIFLDYFKKNNTHIQVVGDENLKNLIKKNKKVIFISGHFANYELMSMEITKRNINLATIYRPLNNHFLNPFMVFLRKKFVCKNQIKKGIKGVREVINYIDRDFSIALMIDQRVSEGEKIDFFGKPALTTTLPAQLALKYKLPIVPVFIERNYKNNFKIIFQKEVEINEYKDKSSLSKKLNKILENMLVKNPNQWIWTHNRWK